MTKSYAVIEFSGADAMSFLQAQLATDLRETVDLQWAWAALCSLKGRVLGTGPLARIAGDRWLWLVSASLATPLSEHLRRYLLRSKVTITIENRPGLTAQTSEGAAPSDEQLQRIEAIGEQRWVLRDLPPGWNLTLALTSATDPNADAPTADWEAARLAAGMTMLTATSSDQHLSHTLQLQQLRAVSLSKGCYPGQEIIARTHYLGRNKRTLAIVSADQTINESDSISSDGAVVGSIIEAIPGGEAIAAVSIAALEKTTWQVGETPLQWRKTAITD